MKFQPGKYRNPCITPSLGLSHSPKKRSCLNHGPPEAKKAGAVVPRLIVDLLVVDLFASTECRSNMAVAQETVPKVAPYMETKTQTCETLALELSSHTQLALTSCPSQTESKAKREVSVKCPINEPNMINPQFAENQTCKDVASRQTPKGRQHMRWFPFSDLQVPRKPNMAKPGVFLSNTKNITTKQMT